MDPSLPSVSTDLTINYPMVGGGPGSTRASRRVALDNITLNLGSLFSKILGPILSDVNNVLGPIKPILDFLNGDVPVVSDLSEEVGLGPVKWDALLALAANLAVADFDASSFDTAISILDTIVNLASQVQTFSDDSTGIDFGNFSFNSSANLTSPTSSLNTADLSQIGSLASSGMTPISRSPRDTTTNDGMNSGRRDLDRRQQRPGFPPPRQPPRDRPVSAWGRT